MNVQIGVDFGVLIAMLINFAIIFLVIRKFATKPIIDALQERKELIKKLENADVTYQEMIDKATSESQEIIKKATSNKEQIIAEAQQLAKREQENILAQSQKDAATIMEKAQENANRLAADFEKNFEQGVKSTTEVVVKKLLGSNAQLEESYVDALLKEIKK